MLSETINALNQTFPQIKTQKTIFDKKQKGIDIVFKNIYYSVDVVDENQASIIPCKKQYIKKQILKGISGIFKAGKVTAIMGASGAGKTTLLNILACRIAPDQDRESKLYANNLEYTYSSFGDFANYVMQTDVLLQTLTVRQTLQFAAKLKLDMPQEERKIRVMQIANQMKLQKCLDTLIGGVIVKGVSGGQKKRVSIAFQLISDPQVIFLDEPTSGLDSLTSYIIVAQLKKLSHKQGKTVIMTIHQPNSQIYELFDDLTLLLQGNIMYQYQASKITDYFEKKFNLICPEYVNPPDFFMSQVHYENQANRERYSEYFSAYQVNQKESVQKMIQQKQTGPVNLRQVNVGNLTALSALIYRSFLNSSRNPMLFKSKVIQTMFLGLLIGGIYFDVGKRDYTNNFVWRALTGMLFFFTIDAVMMVLGPIGLSFPLERDVFFKEQDAKMYNVWQYFFSRNVIEFPQLLIIPVIFALIQYFMVGLANTAEQFFIHILILFLLAFNGSSLGLVIGSIILDGKSVSSLLPVILLPLTIFSGFYKNRGDYPKWIGWIQYVSPNKYGLIAFVENEVAFRSSNVRQLNFQLTKWQSILILFCLGLALRFLALFFLWFLRKKSQ